MNESLPILILAIATIVNSLAILSLARSIRTWRNGR